MSYDAIYDATRAKLGNINLREPIEDATKSKLGEIDLRGAVVETVRDVFADLDIYQMIQEGVFAHLEATKPEATKPEVEPADMVASEMEFRTELPKVVGQYYWYITRDDYEPRVGYLSRQNMFINEFQDVISNGFLSDYRFGDLILTPAVRIAD